MQITASAPAFAAASASATEARVVVALTPAMYCTRRRDAGDDGSVVLGALGIAHQVELARQDRPDDPLGRRGDEVRLSLEVAGVDLVPLCVPLCIGGQQDTVETSG